MDTKSVSPLNQKIQRVHTITCTDALKLSDAITDSHTRIPLVAGYNPALPSISIFHRHIRILSSFQHCATEFKSMPLVRFRSTNKPEVPDSRTSDYLSINVIDCLKSHIFPQDRRERTLRAAILTESSLKVRETAIYFT